MTDSYNKIISTVNSVTTDYQFIADSSNVITIDTSDNRIGIGTLNPEKSLHIKGDNNSGIITTNLEISGGYVNSDLVPETDLSYTLGTIHKKWSDLYIDVSVNNISGSGPEISGSIVDIINEIKFFINNNISGVSGNL